MNLRPQIVGATTTKQVFPHFTDEMRLYHCQPAMMDLQVVPSESRFRRRSGTLSTFPWMTDFMVQPNTVFSDNPTHAPFLQVMHRLEDQLVEGTHSMEVMDIHQAMTVVQPGSVSFPSNPDITPSTARRLCNVMSAYRLMDVLYALQTPPTMRSRNPRYRKLPRKGLMPDAKHWPLEDWVLSFEDGRIMLEEMERFRVSRSPANVSLDAVVQDIDDLSLQVSLFKAMHGFMKQVKGSNLLVNLQAAAFGLSFMLKGCVANDKLAIPNIPDNPESFYNASIAPSLVLTKEERSYLDKFREKQELFKLRHPLYAALLISPLYLISGRKMMSNAWDQSRMLQMSKAIGNDKPDILVRVELGLWKALLSVATGQDTILPAMQAFYAKFSKEDFQGLAAEDREFFSACKSREVEHNDLPSLLLSIEGEMSVPSDWPLSDLRRKNLDEGRDDKEQQNEDRKQRRKRKKRDDDDYGKRSSKKHQDLKEHEKQEHDQKVDGSFLQPIVVDDMEIDFEPSRNMKRVRQSLNDEPIKDDNLYWLKSTFVVFQVERHLFCVPTYRFMDESQVFTKMFKLPKPDGQFVKGSSREDPIVLPDISHHDFQNFLKALYPLTVSTQLTLSKAEWISVLRLSTLWYFLKYRKMAISSLNAGNNLTPVDKIAYGREFRVQVWMKEGCAELVERDRTVDGEEAFTVGFETAFSLFRLREQRIQNIKDFNRMTAVCEALKDELYLVAHSELQYRTDDDHDDGVVQADVLKPPKSESKETAVTSGNGNGLANSE